MPSILMFTDLFGKIAAAPVCQIETKSDNKSPLYTTEFMVSVNLFNLPDRKSIA